MAHGKGPRRWWDGSGAVVVSKEKVMVRGKQVNVLTLDCGHVTPCGSGKRGDPGEFVICMECVELGGRPKEPSCP